MKLTKKHKAVVDTVCGQIPFASYEVAALYARECRNRGLEAKARRLTKFERDHCRTVRDY